MRTESGMCILVLVLFATPLFAQTVVPHSATEDSIAVRDAERVCLSEVLIAAPESDSSAQIAEAKHKAEQVREAVRLGGSFADLAAANSQAPSAAQGGPIGCFKRGTLAKSLEKLVFRMKVGEVSDVIRTRQGWLLLQATVRAEQK
ncbi:MAG: peptidylprolyl isomerase [Candidatus Sulfotelmatobacter sp.]